MRKDIYLKNGNNLMISVTSGYACDVITISKHYMKDINNEKGFFKSFEMSIWDDMSFQCYIKNWRDLAEIEFDFDKTDLIYFCFDRLLGNDSEFIVDDDETSERMENYMVIRREENIIKVTLYNKNPKTRKYLFQIFVKNIGPDARSKMEYKTKLRLQHFFKECKQVMLDDFKQINTCEYRQMSVYEYIEEVEQKRLVKKF